MMQKIFAKILICLLLISCSSCITKYLWGNRTYEENITQFLIGEDGRYVVMVGQYHYVFIDESRIFSRILKLKQTGILTIDAKQSELKLEDNNDIKGFVTLAGPFNFLPIEDIGLLNSMGYYPDQEGNINIKIQVSGRRYQSRYLGQTAQIVNHPLKIYVQYNANSSFAADIGKAAITPVAVGLDAVVLIGRVVMLPFKL